GATAALAIEVAPAHTRRNGQASAFRPRVVDAHGDALLRALAVPLRTVEPRGEGADREDRAFGDGEHLLRAGLAVAEGEQLAGIGAGVVDVLVLRGRDELPRIGLRPRPLRVSGLRDARGVREGESGLRELGGQRALVGVARADV